MEKSRDCPSGHFVSLVALLPSEIKLSLTLVPEARDDSVVCAESPAFFTLGHAAAELAMPSFLFCASGLLGGSPVSSSRWGWVVVLRSAEAGVGGQGGGEESEEAEVSKAGHALGCFHPGRHSCRLGMQTFIHSSGKH